MRQTGLPSARRGRLHSSRFVRIFFLSDGLVYFIYIVLSVGYSNIPCKAVCTWFNLQVKKLEDACAEAARKGQELQKERAQLGPEIKKTQKQINTIGPQIDDEQAARDETDSAMREKELEIAAIENKTVRGNLSIHACPFVN